MRTPLLAAVVLATVVGGAPAAQASGEGQNVVGLQAIDGQSIDTVRITTADVELQDVRQIRVGAITTDDGMLPGNIPEPAAVALLGLGLIGAGYAHRRRP
jgi:hypothetical protein